MNASRSVRHLLCSSAAVAVISSAHAAVQSWNVESGDFLNGANWTPGFVGEWPGDVAEISNGGAATLASGNPIIQAINVGQNGIGSATGTMIQTGGDLVLTDGLVVGRQGSAVGLYEMTGGSLNLVNFRLGGGTTTSQGTMTVSGGSTFVISSGTGHTSIGSPGTGTLTLQNSAVWTHNGANPFLVGSENNSPAVAAGGTGTMHLLSGAQLDIAGTANLTIGRSNGTGGNGTVVVDGGSIAVATGLINLAATNAGVGNPGGTGTLTLTSGSVSAASLNLLEGSSTVNFNGGTATLGGIVKLGNLGSGTVRFNGTTIVARGANANFINLAGTGTGTLTLNVQAGGLILDSDVHAIGTAQALTGVGALTKLGEGTLTLSGANMYAGGTIVAEGALLVAAGGLLGTGNVTVQNGGLLDFDYDFSLTTGALVLEAGSTMVLDQNLTFAGLTIAGDSLDEGVYSYVELESSYGAIFADGGSGQITVVPEPATLALLGLGAASGIAALRRRKMI